MTNDQALHSMSTTLAPATAPAPLFGVTATRAANLPAPVNVRDPKIAQQIVQLTQTGALTKVSDQQVVLFGSDRQKAAAQVLDGILTEVTKGTSPVLFELFKQLSKGMDEADLPALEVQIRESLNKKWWHSILDTLKLSSVAKRIEKANDQIGSLLTSKSASLLTVITEMRKKIDGEVQALITDGQRLNKLGAQFRDDITQFTILVEAAHQILADGEKELALKNSEAKLSGDPLKVEEAKSFEQRVELFRSRVVVLETILARAPVELESIRLTQGAALTTLAETANGATAEFAQIESTLIKLATAHRIANVQAINDERRKLAAQLETYGTTLLGNAATNAAKALGENRVKDAEKLLQFATAIDGITKKVSDEQKQNVTRYEDARRKLVEVKTLMDKQTDVIDITATTVTS